MSQNWKLNGKITFSQRGHDYSTPEYFNPDYHKYLRDFFEKVEKSKNYSYEQLLEIEKNTTPQKIVYRSRGYISLANYMNEIKDPKSKVINEHLPSRTKSNHSARKHFEKIQVVTVNPNGFMSTKEQKVAGIWDENSEQAFNMKVLSLLNRLTQQNMKITIKELLPVLSTPERLNYVAETLTNKASQEHAFASLYANFSSKLKYHGLEDLIITRAKNMFFEYCNQQLNDKSDTHDLTGCSKFVACLICEKSISYKDGIECFEKLIQGLEAPQIAASIVEMFLIFVQNCGVEFAKKVPEATWNRFIRVKHGRDLTSRVKYLLEDVEEIYNEQVLGKPKTDKIEIKPLEQHSETKVYIVRDSFTNYKEGSEATVELPVDEFLRAASSMFPDQTRDPMTYCEFICDILEPKHPDKKILIDILGKCAAEYCQNKIEGDSPKMWSLFDDLLYYMILRKFLDCEDVKIIMNSFPAEHESYIENGMKWFLLDKHYFSKEIDLPNFPSSEVRQALMMPKIIHQEFQPSMLYSRLIAISIIRSIASAISESENPLEELKNYQPFLTLADSIPEIFDNEWGSLIEEYNFEFDVDDIYALISSEEEEEEEGFIKEEEDEKDNRK